MKTSEIKISIIIPVYNVENELANCIESILNQTHNNIELIIVDDGSKDNSASIIDEYVQKDNRIVALHKNNEGVFKARLDGVAVSKGDYIGFVDGDDFVEEKMFETLLCNAVTYNADISHCGYQMVFPDGHIVSYYGTGKKITQNHEQGIADLIRGDFVEPGLCNKLYKKELFNALLKYNFDFTIKNMEDLLMNYFLFKQAEVSIYEDLCFYHYVLRRNSAATSMLNEHKLKDPLKVIKTIYNDSVDTHTINILAEERMINEMIRIALVDKAYISDIIIPFRTEIRKELRHNLKRIVREDGLLKSTKIKAVWAALSPSSYRLVHNVYLKITGLDKKYSLE